MAQLVSAVEHLLLAGLARLKELLLFTFGALQAGETLALTSAISHSLFVVVMTPVVVLFLSRLALRRTVPPEVTSHPSLSSALNQCRCKVELLLAALLLTGGRYPS